MASMRMQMLGSVLVLLGWVGGILTCIMPMWRVTAFIGMTIVTSEIMWEGIWMSCVVQSTGYIQCKPYESMLALSSDLKAAQFLTVGSILTGALGLTMAFVGGKCTRFLDYKGEARKGRIATAAGVTVIIAGLLCLIPVSWSAIVVVQAFYNPLLVDTQRREIGGSVYIGFGASILQILGGGLLCSTSCNTKAEDESPSAKYVIVRSSRAGSSNRSSQRVMITKQSQHEAPFTRSQWSNSQSTNQMQERPASAGSKQSWASTTKSHLATVEAEQSEGPPTPIKAQMVHTDTDQSLVDSQRSELDLEKPEKTYI
ncbi:claudin-4-like [Hoplias malabaricus]|uniref:claudin-4-like n=1 Tax=Hoplias malabaricus TaxID=27720 RepID=UPI003462C813